MNHFDEMIALHYLEGELDSERAEEISSHARQCAGCRGLMRALERESVWLRESLQAAEEPIPTCLQTPPERGSLPWGWITALGLAAGGAYTLWSGFIEPWRTQAAQAGFTQESLLTMLFFTGAFWKGWIAMRNFMEFSALATMGIAVMWMLRRHSRRISTIAIVMGALSVTLTLPPSSRAETHHGNPNYVLPTGQEVKGDLIVTADDTRIDGDIDGDLIVFSKYVTVNGQVKGDVISFVRDLQINGAVDGNVRAFCQAVSLHAAVGKNVTAWTERLELDPKVRIGGSVIAGAKMVQLNGNVGGDVLAFAKEVEINGSLVRDLTVRARLLRIGAGAEVQGRTKYNGEHSADVSPTAKLSSPIEFTIHKRRPDHTNPRYYWHQTLLWGASFIFGLVLLLVAPGFLLDAANACKKYGRAAGFGALVLITVPIAALLVCLTIVGIGVGVAALLLYVIAVYSAQIFVGMWTGEKILGAGVGFGPALGRLALGLAIIRVIELVPLLGNVVAAIVVVWGLGALALTLYKNLRPAAVAA